MVTKRNPRKERKRRKTQQAAKEAAGQAAAKATAETAGAAAAEPPETAGAAAETGVAEPARGAKADADAAEARAMGEANGGKASAPTEPPDTTWELAAATAKAFATSSAIPAASSAASLDDPFEDDPFEEAPKNKAPSDDKHASEGGGAAGEKRAAGGSSSASSTSSPLSPLRVTLIVVAAAVLVLAALTGTYSWDRWWRHDDATDFIGEWRIHNSQATILIDGQRMVLADDAAFSYTLDTKAKTIHLTLGTMEGGGRYRFSPDRTQLVIEDGEYGSWLANAFHDVPWVLSHVANALFGMELADPESDSVSVLDRPEAVAGGDGSAEGHDAESGDATTETEAGGDGMDAPAEDGGGADSSGEGDASGQDASGDESAEGDAAATGKQDTEFTGGTSSGKAGSNAVTIDELGGTSQ